MTKPIHASQEIEEERENGTVFSLNVIWNFELERELLGFGEKVEVLQPARLRYKIKKRLEEALGRYNEREEI